MKTIIYLIYLSFYSYLQVELVSAQKTPRDFAISFKFGYHENDATIYDSKKSKLIVHGIDTVMTFKLKLSGDEKQKIYDELQKIDFLNYPENYLYQRCDTEEVYGMAPCRHFFLTTVYNHNSKTVNWDNCFQSKTKDEKHTALMKLDRVVEKIIWASNPLKDYHPTRMKIDPN